MWGLAAAPFFHSSKQKAPVGMCPFAMAGGALPCTHTVGTSLFLFECIPVPALPPLLGQTWGMLPILSVLQ